MSIICNYYRTKFTRRTTEIYDSFVIPIPNSERLARANTGTHFTYLKVEVVVQHAMKVQEGKGE
jgi:hypothetical protein